LLTELGIERPIALVGYVFREALARERPAAIRGFFDAVAAANSILLVSDQEWTRLRPIMKAESDQEFEGLKARFRAGIPQSRTAGTITDTERLYQLLAERGGDALLGARTRFDQNAFWNSNAP
jgi:NitT/TauT family transport system substrate-binding protein